MLGGGTREVLAWTYVVLPEAIRYEVPLSPAMTPTEFLASLRTTLGLTQAEMSVVLGLKGRSLARIEGGATLTPTIERLARLVANLRLGELESALRAAMGADFTPLESRIRELVQGQIAKGASINDTLLDIAGRKQRPSDWVYWATGARASATETRGLADDAGFICRPLRFSHDGKSPSEASHLDLPTDYPYLLELKPGDSVLLCHSGQPLSWYRLKLVRTQEPKQPPAHLPHPIIRFVHSSTPLGVRLQAGKYRFHDGSRSGTKPGWFSGLAVDALRRPVEVPAPRRPGIRDTMTPFSS